MSGGQQSWGYCGRRCGLRGQKVSISPGFPSSAVPVSSSSFSTIQSSRWCDISQLWYKRRRRKEGEEGSSRGNVVTETHSAVLQWNVPHNFNVQKPSVEHYSKWLEHHVERAIYTVRVYETTAVVFPREKRTRKKKCGKRIQSWGCCVLGKILLLCAASSSSFSSPHIRCDIELEARKDFASAPK